jgi:exodeoxyribonuclease VII small subunit
MTQKQTFEQALERLDEISSRLESGEVSLEESIKMYEEGMKLIEFCNSKLNEALKKIQKLSKSPEGKFETEPLEGDIQE